MVLIHGDDPPELNMQVSCLPQIFISAIFLNPMEIGFVKGAFVMLTSGLHENTSSLHLSVGRPFDIESAAACLLTIKP